MPVIMVSWKLGKDVVFVVVVVVVAVAVVVVVVVEAVEAVEAVEKSLQNFWRKHVKYILWWVQRSKNMAYVDPMLEIVMDLVCGFKEMSMCFVLPPHP